MSVKRKMLAVNDLREVPFWGILSPRARLLANTAAMKPRFVTISLHISKKYHSLQSKFYGFFAFRGNNVVTL